jgi:para-aminobenzoate synthetase / 4-amino-4-deoxychorismate lyase
VVIADQSEPIARQLGSPYAVALGPGPEPARLIAKLDVKDRPAVLWGNWFGGGVVVLRSPLRRLSRATAADVAALVDDQPTLIAWSPQDDSGTAVHIGGGWVGCLGFSPGTSAACFYDSLLRWRQDTGWTFEALGFHGREAHLHAELDSWRRLLLSAGDTIPPAGLAGRFATIEPPALSQLRYLAGVEAVIGNINSGRFYQLNLCTRLSARSLASAPVLFAHLAEQLNPAYGALLVAQPDDQHPGPVSPDIVSLSPELFLRVRGGEVITSPIKGTAPRQLGDIDAPSLRASAKDAAENIMIVDLMRNDLSRVCRPGTVQVDRLLELQAHPGVWHLVSTVTGQLADGVTTGKLLEATFPPGSVTGAPKSSALQGIADFEPYRRGAYTGALGLVSPIAGADFSVLIRTLECSRDRIELGVGGGITVDSSPITEWYECLAKAAPLVSALGSKLHLELQVAAPQPTARQLTGGLFETVLAIGSSVLRLAAHLARLDRSCHELYGAGIPDDLAGRMAAIVAADPSPPPRRAVRVIARPNADGLAFDVSFAPLLAQASDSRLSCAERSASTWRHKWADRAELLAAEQASTPELPYFLTAAGSDRFVAETSRGNLFCKVTDGTWLTPPLDEDVLPGVTRRDVLDIFSRAQLPLRIARFTAEQFQHSRGAFWTSSLRGAVPITAVDGVRLPASDQLANMINAELGVGKLISRQRRDLRRFC